LVAIHCPKRGSNFGIYFGNGWLIESVFGPDSFSMKNTYDTLPAEIGTCIALMGAITSLYAIEKVVHPTTASGCHGIVSGLGGDELALLIERLALSARFRSDSAARPVSVHTVHCATPWACIPTPPTFSRR